MTCLEFSYYACWLVYASYCGFRPIIHNSWFFFRTFIADSFLPTAISSPSLAHINAFFWPSNSTTSLNLQFFFFLGHWFWPPVSDFPSLSTALLGWIVYHKRHFILKYSRYGQNHELLLGPFTRVFYSTDIAQIPWMFAMTMCCSSCCKVCITERKHMTFP